MNIIRLIVFFTSLLSSGFLAETMAQPGDLGDLSQISEKGQLKGIFSFTVTRFLSSRTSTRLFVAAWYVSENSTRVAQRRLVIFEKEGVLYKEVFNFQEKEQVEFLEFGSLNSLTVPGIVVNFSSELNGAGPSWVVALVQDKFQIVYQGGTSEIVDLDGNGIPEVFESEWPDGDGYPRNTLIHVWDGTRYRKLTTSCWEYRFSKSILNRLRRYDKIRK